MVWFRGEVQWRYSVWIRVGSGTTADWIGGSGMDMTLYKCMPLSEVKEEYLYYIVVLLGE